VRVPFETFKRQRVRPGREPFLTIQRKGVFSLNRPAFEALEQPESVELLYDPEARLIGLRKVDSGLEHAYMVRSLGGRGADSTFLISGTAFTNYYGIDTSTSTRRTGRMEGDMLVIDLNDPGTEVSSNRRRKATRTPPPQQTLRMETS
jgi:hypothetical protein